METKSIGFEVKDFSKEKRTAVIAHAVYGNIDLTGDISTKGMFNSSWARGGQVAFYFNHNDELSPGKVTRTFEDDQKAYTEVKFGPYTLGTDVLEMVDFGVITGASFGYETEKKDYINKSGKQVRRLLQVKHNETSLLTKTAANPLAGVVSYSKALNNDQVKALHASIENMEKFCRNTTASDESIISILEEIKSAKSILSAHDTASTPLITDGEASVKEFSDALHLLTLKI